MKCNNARRGFTRNCHPEFISGSHPYKESEEMLRSRIKYGMTAPINNENNKYAGDPRVLQTAKSGMTLNLMGFTLIELLVVVLIIGILAAVAFPQYQKAVVKSRFAEAISNLKTISQADKACRLAKDYCGMDELDVEVGTDINRWGSNTENFQYQTGLIHGIVAQYNKEDVCLCLYDSGKFVVKQWREKPDCVSKAASMDYAKLLNLPDADELDEDEEGSDCCCC